MRALRLTFLLLLLSGWFPVGAQTGESPSPDSMRSASSAPSVTPSPSIAPSPSPANLPPGLYPAVNRVQRSTWFVAPAYHYRLKITLANGNPGPTPPCVLTARLAPASKKTRAVYEETFVLTSLAPGEVRSLQSSNVAYGLKGRYLLQCTFSPAAGAPPARPQTSEVPINF